MIFFSRQTYDTMIRLKIILVFLIFYSLISCTNNQDSKKFHPQFEKYYGIYIDHSMRTGSGFKNSRGENCFFTNVRAVITNDSIIPLNIKINFPTDSLEVIPQKEQKFNVLLLPETMTNSKQRGENYQISNELKDLIDSLLIHPFTIDKVLKPGEKCIVNIGLIVNNKYNLNPYYSIFSKGHKPHPWPRKERFSPIELSDNILSIPDSALHSFPQGDFLSLSLGISFYGDFSYCVVPCGQIVFKK